MQSSDPVKGIEPSKDLPWYISNLQERVAPEIRRLLEEYSHIPPADVLQHIHTVRDKAWAIRPYPCTGLGAFLQPMICKSPAYSEIIKLLQDGASLLDIGCFMGQDLRRLAFDGAPSSNLYALDIVNHWDLGYEFFRDEDRFQAKFIEGDVMDIKGNEKLRALKEKMDIITVTHVLHQWDWTNQIFAAEALVSFSKPGTLIVGFQIGTAGGATKVKGMEKWNSWMRQDPESWGEMWEIAGKKTGTEWKSEAKLMTFEELGFDTKDTEYLGNKARVLQFVIKRIK